MRYTENMKRYFTKKIVYRTGDSLTLKGKIILLFVLIIIGSVISSSIIQCG
jgi:hypothetical protein